MREQVENELLVRLAARVHADVRQRRGGEQPAHEVERLRANGAPVRGGRLAFAGREAIRDPRRRVLEQPRVRREQVVHRVLVRLAEARVAVIAVAVAVELRVVGDVARRLLEIRGEPRALQDLRQEVRRPLARDVCAAELRDRVVAVADEDALVQLRRALPLRALDGRHLRHRVGELVEEEPPQRAGIARVAGEQRALHRLRQVDEPEHRPVEVREVRREALALLVGERLHREWQALHGGHGREHASAGLGRHIGLVLPVLAAGLLPGRARPVRRSSRSTRSASGRSSSTPPGTGCRARSSSAAGPSRRRTGSSSRRSSPATGRAPSTPSTPACARSATGSGRCASRSRARATRARSSCCSARSRRACASRSISSTRRGTGSSRGSQKRARCA